MTGSGGGGYRVCDREFGEQEIALIREVVGRFGSLSRTELAKTVCELVDWRRRNGSLKGRECAQLLEELESQGVVKLPAKRPRRPAGSRTRVPVTSRGEAGPELVGVVGEFAPVVLERVWVREQRELFRELIGRYHYLGHAMPFGAHLRYLVYVCKPHRTLVGCMQFSSAAWRMAARDRWIGWSEQQRRERLPWVVSNSRFLILPWVRVKNLASTVLSLSVRQVVADWREHYAVSPLLVETLVDASRYQATSYRAANWMCLGMTAGRGRMDGDHQRHGYAPKQLWVYPLQRHALARLRGQGDGSLSRCA